jgi:phospho-N-acetylmuramoyl-pentapeptide-transferase
MLYHLLFSLHQSISFFNIFRYITFRSAMACLTAFSVSLILGPLVVRMLTNLKIGENIRTQESQKLYELHRNKQNTPTMGGILILLAIFCSVFLWADLSNHYIILVSWITFWLGVIGFMDDYLKQIRKRSKGLTITAKFTGQILLGLVVGIILFLSPHVSTRLDVPFLKEVTLELGIFYVLFVILVITATSNAVNLTDGLDGLAIGIVIMVSLAFAVLSYVSGNLRFSQYLLIPYLPGAGELTVFCAALMGAGLGFLWFNCYPASVFMGDVGSLSIGGALGTVALLIKKELLLVIVGGVFVIEALSVILQVASFRIFHRRIFRIAPLHHHFQFMGWPESKVIIRFWIVASLFALLTLVTLKIR